ncbi:MAG: hypothetical protein ACYTG0_27060, partial [Planctomycetota bacterium]
YRMVKSTDNGKTWSEPITLIDSGHKQKEKYDEVYAHGFSVEKGGFVAVVDDGVLVGSKSAIQMARPG